MFISLMDFFNKDPIVLEFERRERNRLFVHSLKQGICPSCKEEAVQQTTLNHWECFQCHEEFSASYQPLDAPLSKPALYQDH